MINIQNSETINNCIECELSDKFRRKEIVKKIKTDKSGSLEIEISCLKIYDKLDEHLRELLQANPTNVISLTIILNQLDLSEDVYKTISTNICKLNKLKELNIELSSCNIQDNHIQQILYEMVDLDQLQQLSIDISNNKQLTNNVSQFLGLTVSQLTKLQKFYLNIQDCYEIDNTFIDKFSQLVRRMISLQEISLHISQTKINEFKFINNIGQIPKLQSVSISYNFSNKEQEQSFIDNISTLSQKIKSLSLQIQNSQTYIDEKTDDHFFKQLGIVLNEFQYLKEFYINCENIVSYIDITKLLQHMADKIIQGVHLCINIKDSDINSKIHSITKQSHLEQLRVLALFKLQNHFKNYLQLLD